jgi:hypothetical protein
MALKSALSDGFSSARSNSPEDEKWRDTEIFSVAVSASERALGTLINMSPQVRRIA